MTNFSSFLLGRRLLVLALPLAGLLTRPAQAQLPTYQSATVYSTGPGPIASPVQVVAADVNGDGKLDLLAANNYINTVGVLLGNGNGTFQPVASFSTGAGSNPSGVAVADVNGDGNPDLLTANYGSNTASVLLGNGNGTFQPVVAFSTGAASQPYKIAVADVNGDGQPDLLTANYGSNTAGVLLGNGNGTFQPVVAFSTGAGSAPFSITVGDVNTDGKPDLLVANSGNDTVGVLLGNGDGTFQPVASFSTGAGSYPSGVAVADVNGDNLPDLLSANYGPSTAGVLLGNGNGTFQPVVAFSVGANNKPMDITVADVNGDGRLDLLTANFSTTKAGVLRGNGDGTFQALLAFDAEQQPYPGFPSFPRSIAVGDANGDGKPDLFLANTSTSKASVLLNTTVYAAPTLTTLSPASGAAGTRVTLTGTNLSGATSVSFNGTPANSFVVNSATSITAVVAAGTTTGPVRVSTPGGAATSGTSFVVSGAPVTVADAYTTPAGTALAGNVLTNDLGTNLRAILINRPANGTLVLNPDGSFTYQPNAGFSGMDSFLYYACNVGTALVCGAPATVSITVLGGGPVTVADSYSTPAGVALAGNVLTNDLGTNLRAILINRPANGTLVLNPDGSFNYRPAAGYVGADSFLYYACNVGAALVCGDPATVSISVGPATASAKMGATITAAPAKSAASAAGGAASATALALTGYPNPFGDELRLSFALPQAQAYTLAVYDAQGRLVRQLASGQAEAGQAQELTVPTQNYAAGLYFVRLSTAAGTQLLKLIKQ